MQLRVVLPDGHARKLVSDATSVARLRDDIVNKFKTELPLQFIMHYYDDDFGDYFTLDCDENIEEKMTVKIVANTADTVANAVTPGRNDETPSTSTDTSSSSSSVNCDNLRTKDISKCYSLPKFDKDIEMVLCAASSSYQKDGSVTPLSHGLKSRVLTRIVSDIYENYNAYPSTSELEVVAKMLTSTYEGVRDHPGRGHEGWLNSLIFKMGNYRTTLRKTGSLEMSIHGGKRSKYCPNLPSARQGMKKMKMGSVNWQPEYPDGEDDVSLGKHKLEMISEMEKAHPDQRLMSKKMAVTFALRRRDINKNLPLTAIKDQWPALFSVTALEAEFSRLTNVSARRQFFSSLDQNADNLLELLKERSGVSGKTINEYLSVIDTATDDGEFVTVKRDAILKGVIVYLGTDVTKLCHHADESDVSSPVFIQSDDNKHEVIIEKVTVCATSSICEAILCLLLSHYIFNLQYGQFKIFLLFIQVFLLGINDDDSKLPAKLRSFIGKIATVAKRSA